MRALRAPGQACLYDLQDQIEHPTVHLRELQLV